MNFPDANDLFFKTIERKYEKELTMIYDQINSAYLNDCCYAKIKLQTKTSIDFYKEQIEKDALCLDEINLSEIITYLNLKNYTTNYDSFYFYIDWSHDV